MTISCSAGVAYLIAVDGFLGANGSVILNVTPVLSIPGSGLASSNLFKLAIFAPSGSSVVLEASTNLQTWVPVSTNTAPADGILQINKSTAGSSVRFYRARMNAPSRIRRVAQQETPFITLAIDFLWDEARKASRISNGWLRNGRHLSWELQSLAKDPCPA